LGAATDWQKIEHWVGAPVALISRRARGDQRIDIPVRRVPGTALAHQATGEVIDIPPFGEDLLRTKLANRERYLHEQRDIDPLMERLRQHEHWRACVWP